MKPLPTPVQKILYSSPIFLAIEFKGKEIFGNQASSLEK